LEIPGLLKFEGWINLLHDMSPDVQKFIQAEIPVVERLWNDTLEASGLKKSRDEAGRGGEEG
jgi:hypothetical protein